MIGIVIVNYKTHIETINFIKNELSKIRTPAKIVIVNNEARQDDADFYKGNICAELVTSDFSLINIESNIFLINSKNNLGFAKGNNLGAEFLLKYFDIKYLLFSNNDLKIISQNIIEQLIQKLEQISSASVIGPKIIDCSGNLISPRFDRVSPWRFIIHYLFYPIYSKHVLSKLGIKTKGKTDFEMREMYEGFCYWVSGSFMLIKVTDFILVKGFDPNTFLYCEEKILSEKLLKINKKVYYYSEPRILSIGGLTTSKYLSNIKRDKILFDSEMYYYHFYRNTSFLTNMVLLITRFVYFNLFYKLYNGRYSQIV